MAGWLGALYPSQTLSERESVMHLITINNNCNHCRHHSKWYCHRHRIHFLPQIIPFELMERRRQKKRKGRRVKIIAVMHCCLGLHYHCCVVPYDCSNLVCVWVTQLELNPYLAHVPCILNAHISTGKNVIAVCKNQSSRFTMYAIEYGEPATNYTSRHFYAVSDKHV